MRISGCGTCESVLWGLESVLCCVVDEFAVVQSGKLDSYVSVYACVRVRACGRASVHASVRACKRALVCGERTGLLWIRFCNLRRCRNNSRLDWTIRVKCIEFEQEHILFAAGKFVLL
jgi:hypothetical protein